MPQSGRLARPEPLVTQNSHCRDSHLKNATVVVLFNTSLIQCYIRPAWIPPGTAGGYTYPETRPKTRGLSQAARVGPAHGQI